jgi:hypothetical protein
MVGIAEEPPCQFFYPKRELDPGQLQTELAKHQKIFQCSFRMLLVP